MHANLALPPPSSASPLALAIDRRIWAWHATAQWLMGV